MIERSANRDIDILGLNLAFGIDVVTAFTFGRQLATNLISALLVLKAWRVSSVAHSIPHRAKSLLYGRKIRYGKNARCVLFYDGS